ncbi:DUF2946 family protein [Roseomonas sp. NAR14]|uniref:DUF2946 family protein n=1 Tax=Roseomonas acroporae TaxID=2937791 RepID=A0A9X2BSS5_9PROT|nr:DUF2946 family protein [Roseomonas acroporae]MCK8783447.1 DUF2946 family protein [Roseomonas acroporae]
MRPERRRRPAARGFLLCLLALLFQVLGPVGAAWTVARAAADPFANPPLCAGHDTDAAEAGPGAPRRDPHAACGLCHGCCAVAPAALPAPPAILSPPAPVRVVERPGLRPQQPRAPPCRPPQARAPPTALS